MCPLYLYQYQYPEGIKLRNKNFKIFFKFWQELIFAEERILMNFAGKIFYLLLCFSYMIKKDIYKAKQRLDFRDSKFLNIYGN